MSPAGLEAGSDHRAILGSLTSYTEYSHLSTMAVGFVLELTLLPGISRRFFRANLDGASHFQ